ncbi:hypothetical protein F4553_000944 [Allocatelliglobosispora scoriae]|uniref:Uncharacterized protein n=2 Tax=Allocatelliglobosispora scoriae TaxID=643052 RepID=A0A841BIX2_9ACTN|nr:hypothetical protein [Allocatelliglobosispora scoriae]
MIGALALAGVALSLALQNRQNGIHRVELLRNMQLELTKMGMSDPALTRPWDEADDVPTGHIVEHRYINMWFMYYLAGYRIGEFSEGTIRHIARRDFTSERIVQYWSEDRAHHAAEAHDKVKRKFIIIIEAEYRARMMGPRDQEISNNN